MGFQVEFQALVKHSWGTLISFNGFVACVVSTSWITGICRMQLAINVQIPYDFGGLGGKAIYIGK